jgi:hypothetical protein
MHKTNPQTPVQIAWKILTQKLPNMQNATHLSAKLRIGSVQLVLQLAPTSSLQGNGGPWQQSFLKTGSPPKQKQGGSLNRLCSRQKVMDLYVTKLMHELFLFP